MGKSHEHYVNNNDFVDALVIYRNIYFSWKDLVTELCIYYHNIIKCNSYVELYYLCTLYEYLIVAILNKPKINDYLVLQLTKIATRYATKPIHINRTYKEDMINSAVENCLKYITNFDPAITTNAFSYFTQIIHYSFLRTVQSENKQRDIESKIIADAEFSTFFESNGLEDHERSRIKEQLELRNRKLSC